jgi:hypothetical protein
MPLSSFRAFGAAGAEGFFSWLGLTQKPVKFETSNLLFLFIFVSKTYKFWRTQSEARILKPQSLQKSCVLLDDEAGARRMQCNAPGT